MQVETGHHLCWYWSSLTSGAGRTKASCCLLGVFRYLRDFRKVHSMSQERPLMWRSRWKRLGQVCELGGVGQTLLAR